MRALGLPARDYAVFGSGPLLACGLVSEVHDIDLLARGAAWARAQRLGPVQTAPRGDEVVRLGDLEIFSAWLGMDIHAVINRAEVVDGLPIARLEDVAHYKRRLGRPKDLEHLRLIAAHSKIDVEIDFLLPPC